MGVIIILLIIAIILAIGFIAYTLLKAPEIHEELDRQDNKPKTNVQASIGNEAHKQVKSNPKKQEKELKGKKELRDFINNIQS